MAICSVLIPNILYDQVAAIHSVRMRQGVGPHWESVGDTEERRPDESYRDCLMPPNEPSQHEIEAILSRESDKGARRFDDCFASQLEINREKKEKEEGILAGILSKIGERQSDEELAREYQKELFKSDLGVNEEQAERILRAVHGMTYSEFREKIKEFASNADAIPSAPPLIEGERKLSEVAVPPLPTSTQSVHEHNVGQPEPSAPPLIEDESVLTEAAVRRLPPSSQFVYEYNDGQPEPSAPPLIEDKSEFSEVAVQPPPSPSGQSLGANSFAEGRDAFYKTLREDFLTARSRQEEIARQKESHHRELDQGKHAPDPKTSPATQELKEYRKRRGMEEAARLERLHHAKKEAEEKSKIQEKKDKKQQKEAMENARKIEQKAAIQTGKLVKTRLEAKIKQRKLEQGKETKDISFIERFRTAISTNEKNDIQKLFIDRKNAEEKRQKQVKKEAAQKAREQAKLERQATIEMVTFYRDQNIEREARAIGMTKDEYVKRQAKLNRQSVEAYLTEREKAYGI